ncbi:MAG: hypothetical protein U0163_07840 [Gemmatimonadaceae bacterium]
MNTRTDDVNMGTRDASIAVTDPSLMTGDVPECAKEHQRRAWTVLSCEYLWSAGRSSLWRWASAST